MGSFEMNCKFRRFYPQTLCCVLVIFVFAIYGCAGLGGQAQAPVEPNESVSPPPPKEAVEIQKSSESKVLEQPYDLESEMPKDDSVGDLESKTERIKPLLPDSFSVEESLEPAVNSTAEYDLGYRVQLAAFTDAEGARDLKKIVMAATGMAVYIDYEDGLYKVRAGDFDTRAEASEARARLTADYPDCWIVRTTVKKTK
jgi:cell division protein FtsN